MIIWQQKCTLINQGAGFLNINIIFNTSMQVVRSIIKGESSFPTPTPMREGIQLSIYL